MFYVFTVGCEHNISREADGRGGLFVFGKHLFTQFLQQFRRGTNGLQCHLDALCFVIPGGIEAEAGKVTDRLHSIQKGVELGIRGPYGKGYPLNEFKGKEIYIVGGGVGLAPLRSLLLALLNTKEDYKKIIFRYGARTPNDIIYKNLVEEWKNGTDIDVKLTVDKADNSWKGNEGVVTTILDNKDVNIENAVGVVCGPPIMMKFATFKLVEMGFKDSQIYLSMEKNMSCGIGKCGHCRVGNFYCCKEGPVFTYDQIKDFPEIWD